MLTIEGSGVVNATVTLARTGSIIYVGIHTVIMVEAGAMIGVEAGAMTGAVVDIITGVVVDAMAMVGISSIIDVVVGLVTVAETDTEMGTKADELVEAVERKSITAIMGSDSITMARSG